MTTKTRTSKATTNARKAAKTTKAPATKPAARNATRTQREAKDPKSATKRVSQIDAAVIVLEQFGEPMSCKAMVEAMRNAGLWTGGKGATPDATLYSSILREMRAKGNEARFLKTDRGRFALAPRS